MRRLVRISGRPRWRTVIIIAVLSFFTVLWIYGHLPLTGSAPTAGLLHHEKDHLSYNYDEGRTYEIKQTFTRWQQLSNYQKQLLNCSGFDVQRDSGKIHMNFMPDPLRYNETYRSPCWHEPIPSSSPYEHNVYFKTENRKTKKVIPVLNGLNEYWKKQMESGETHRLRCLPYFYIIGSPKSGSTSLYFSLLRHQNIVGTIIKETHWWSKYRLGLKFGQWASFSDFVDMSDKAAIEVEKIKLNGFHPLAIGEGSVPTLHQNDRWPLYPGNEGLQEPAVLSAHHIHHLTKDAKLILILRDPAERVFSQYLEDAHWEKYEASVEDFHERVQRSITLLNQCFSQRPIRACLYDACVNSLQSGMQVKLRQGLYAVYIQDWLRVFPRQQLLILFFEEFVRNRTEVLTNVTKFLQIGKYPPEVMLELSTQIRHRHGRQVEHKALGDMLPQTRRLLRKLYRPHNQQLYEILNTRDYVWNYDEDILS